MGTVGWRSNTQIAEEARQAALEAERGKIERELRATDHTQLPDFGGGRSEWATYRQAVMDRLTEIEGLTTAEEVRAHPWPTVPATDWRRERNTPRR